MKKVLFVTMFAIGALLISTNANAQNNANEGKIESIARKAAMDAGCLDGATKVDFSTNAVGVCSGGPAISCVLYEVSIFGKITGPSSTTALPVPYASVQVCACTGEVISVTCL